MQSVFFDKSNPHGICLSALRGRNILVPHGQSAVRKVLTAYGDGLWGLQNTDITDAHRSIITDLLILFLMALWAYGS